jgi:hypothetical protein
MRLLLATTISMFAVLGPLHSAAAQEYCVTCTEPDAKYRCVVAGTAPDGQARRGQLLCITEVAKLGSHASCSVGAMNAGPCTSKLPTITVTAETPLPAAAPLGTAASPTAGEPPSAPSTAPATAAAEPVSPAVSPSMSPAGSPAPVVAPAATPPPPATAQPAAEPAPPNTVEELAKQTVQSSQEGIKQAGKAVTDTAQSAGNAVGNAMKKTWNCVSSFFGNC